MLVLDEPLPSASHLERIVQEAFHAANLGEPARLLTDRAVDALIGLAAFPAEQALAISLVKRELDTEDLWERKRQIIEQTPGLSVWRGGESFGDLGGLSNVKSFLLAVLQGVDPPLGPEAMPLQGLKPPKSQAFPMAGPKPRPSVPSLMWRGVSLASPGGCCMGATRARPRSQTRLGRIT